MYDDRRRSAHALRRGGRISNITAVLGMITNNRVIAASGSEIYVIELPE